MSAIYVLIGVSIPIAAGFLLAFLWSAKNGQFDDDYTPSLRMLRDDEVRQDQTDNQNEKS
jgi:cbb3-type cytochrome oxidase maturation protein